MNVFSNITHCSIFLFYEDILKERRCLNLKKFWHSFKLSSGRWRFIFKNTKNNILIGSCSILSSPHKWRKKGVLSESILKCTKKTEIRIQFDHFIVSHRISFIDNKFLPIECTYNNYINSIKSNSTMYPLETSSNKLTPSLFSHTRRL